MNYMEETSYRDVCREQTNDIVKHYLCNLIYSEQPHLAEGMRTDTSDEDINSLLQICKFLTAVLNNEEPPTDCLNWSLEFEGKYHTIAMIALRAASK